MVTGETPGGVGTRGRGRDEGKGGRGCHVVGEGVGTDRGGGSAGEKRRGADA